MNNKCPLVVFSTWHPEHAQKVMQRLGIRYLHAVPQSIADCWQFYCCEDIPNYIPEDDKKFLSFAYDYQDPFRSIGYGLNKEMAEDIQKWIENN